MWTRKDVAQALLAAILFLIVGLLLFPPVSRPAVDQSTSRPSPAKWLVQHTHAPYGYLVDALCHPSDGAELCRLTVQRATYRGCWFIELAPHRHGWHVAAVVPLARRECPTLRVRSGSGPHALRN